jgi:hypothetical protein
MNPAPPTAPDPDADPAVDATEVPAAGPAGDAGTATPPADPEACAVALRERFPALFGGAPKPLKLRIQADIQARAPGVFTKAALSAFLRRHTGRHGYLLALIRERQRFDLDGQPAGELSAEHREAAAAELARRRALHGQRQREIDAQRRERAALLHDFETSRLSVANFCALKRIPPTALEPLLARARVEAAERAAEARARSAAPAGAAAVPPGRSGPRGPAGSRGAADPRGPRPPAARERGRPPPRR